MKKAAIIVATIGGIVVLFSGFVLLTSLKTKDWPSVNGTVTDVQDNGYASGSSNSSKRKEYKVSVEYTINDQQGTKQYTTQAITNVGDTVAVRYNPNNTSETTTGKFSDTIIASSIVGGAGLILFLAGGGYAVYQRRQQQK